MMSVNLKRLQTKCKAGIDILKMLCKSVNKNSPQSPTLKESKMQMAALEKLEEPIVQMEHPDCCRCFPLTENDVTLTSVGGFFTCLDGALWELQLLDQLG